jgi:hypothetical protein
MNDSLAQHVAQTPSPLTGSRQRQAFSVPRRWVEMERDGDASASMGGG